VFDLMLCEAMRGFLTELDVTCLSPYKPYTPAYLKAPRPEEGLIKLRCQVGGANGQHLQ
jgi:hypothetical protein